MLAMVVRAPRGIRQPASSLTSIASMLAPTGMVYTSRCSGDCKIAFASKSNRRTAAPTRTAPVKPNHEAER